MSYRSPCATVGVALSGTTWTTSGPAAPAPDPLCQTNLDVILTTCADLGFTSNPAKTVAPCTTLELLGIELDSVSQEARISQTRLDESLNLRVSQFTDVANQSLLHKEIAPVPHWKSQLHLLSMQTM